jgi:hypothetical protein
LGEAAGACHADHRAVDAQVVAALRAELAVTAGDQRIHRDLAARARSFEDFTRRLVSKDQRRSATRIATVIGMHVRAADPRDIHANEHLAD